MSSKVWVKQNPIIAIDGPAASGKGTLARKIAEHYDYDHLDTGKIYRALGKKLIDIDGSIEDEDSIQQAISLLCKNDFADPSLTEVEVGKWASKVAAISWVREELLDFQREIAYKAAKGSVLDGRDVGTVVCPDADVKFFVTADLETRIQRRLQELSKNNPNVAYEDVALDLRKRDERDQNRTAAPLVLEKDYIVFDTTQMDQSEMIAQALEKINNILQN